MERIPSAADKFASRHGIKGVVGLIILMKICHLLIGIVPDYNKSTWNIYRMSTGHLLEAITGKTCSGIR